jgi:hypothetical protein
MTTFRDRQDAGEKLGASLELLQLQDPIVLALPSGGVPVAIEVAKVLKAPLDLLIVRKVGAPGNPELAVAAIVDGDPPDVVLNREIVEGRAGARRVGAAPNRISWERSTIIAKQAGPLPRDAQLPGCHRNILAKAKVWLPRISRTISTPSKFVGVDNRPGSAATLSALR